MPASLPQLLYPVALVLMIIGLILCVRRLSLGFALVGGVAVAYGLWTAYQLGWAVGGMLAWWLALILVLTILGASLEAISERLHLRVGWVRQDTVWGGLIGGMIGLFVLGGAFPMLLGTLIGTVVVQFSGRTGRVPPGRALVDGFEGFYAMFGAVGLRVLFAVVIIDAFLNLAHFGAPF